eukprot:CAMPEP_0119502930 /NCGR_PEP_ID=MMETSP1344-20130328/24244_2 /TAXON_ID=236787 /ORGANISM="Florenciella parvula, Strain CCMP2471" /LENGTH=116 /DNA_ID=CAMNT_0007539167 /DNA_START=242 /DNA_END=590 /DNA_ORIENTATION=-
MNICNRYDLGTTSVRPLEVVLRARALTRLARVSSAHLDPKLGRVDAAAHVDIAAAHAQVDSLARPLNRLEVVVALLDAVEFSASSRLADADTPPVESSSFDVLASAVTSASSASTS